MGQQVIKQPNGLYCIYNSISSGITYYDLTSEEILKIWVQEERDRLAWNLLKLLHQIDEGKPAYHQFTKTFEKALGNTAEEYGEKERQEILEDMMSIKDATKKLAGAKRVTLPEDMQELLAAHLKR